MLSPKKAKHRKWRKGRGRNKGVETRGAELSFGSYGIKAMSACWLTARQIEAARRAMTRYVQRGGKIWIRVFPDKPVTKKGIEVSMGGGKGSVEEYVMPIKPGRIIFEIDGVPEKLAKEAMRRASHKLPIKTKFVVKND